MPFVKLDCGLVDSTIFCEPNDAFKAWITLLLKCGPDGVASITVPMLAKLCDTDVTRMEEIIENFCQPEQHSRTTNDGGIRLRRVEGGYLVLNYQKYRAKDYGATARSKRFRDKKRDATALQGVPIVTATQAEAEAEAEVYAEKNKSRATALPTDFSLTPERREYALSKGIVAVAEEFEAFCAHHTAHGKVMKSWDAAWRTWCLNTKKFNGGSREPVSSASDKSILRQCRERGISTVGKTAEDLINALRAKS